VFALLAAEPFIVDALPVPIRILAHNAILPIGSSIKQPINANATQSLTPKISIPAFRALLILHFAMLAPLMEQNQPVQHAKRPIS
jgi:hypothetical protein